MVSLACDTRNEPDCVAPSSNTIIRICFDGVSGDINVGSITHSRGRFGHELGELPEWGDSVMRYVPIAGGDGCLLGAGCKWALVGEMSNAVGQ